MVGQWDSRVLGRHTVNIVTCFSTLRRYKELEFVETSNVAMLGSHVAILLLHVTTLAPCMENFAVWSQFHGCNHDPKKMIKDYDSMTRELLKKDRSTPLPLEGKCWGNGLYPNVLSQGRLFQPLLFLNIKFSPT